MIGVKKGYIYIRELCTNLKAKVADDSLDFVA